MHSTRSRRVLFVVAALAVAMAGVAGAQTINPANEGYDPMRQITSQFLPPNMMIVLDQSGSLGFTVSYTRYDDWYYVDNKSHMFWAFRPPGSNSSQYANVAADFSIDASRFTHGNGYDGNYSCNSCSFYPAIGAGQGYWVKAGAGVVFTASESSKNGLIRSSYRNYVYVARPANGWSVGDTIQLSDASRSADNGLYQIATTPIRSGWNTSYDYFSVYRINDDGSVQSSYYTFSNNSDDAVTLQKGTLSEGSSIWYFVPPSRAAIIKNALGPHIRLYEPSVAPSGTDGIGKPYYTFSGNGPTGGAYYNWTTKAWVNWSSASSEPVGDASYTRTVQPVDLVGNTVNTVNWGLVTFQDTCNTQNLRVNVDSNNNATQVAAIQAYMNTVASGGLNPLNGTPTRAGLQRAIANDALPTTYYRDAQRTCGRMYGVILVTDGESNNCNPNNASWSSCPTNWASYPAGVADDLWNATAPPNVRTYVIGVSPDVGRCELNYTAYRGRTDASSPNDDSGFDTTNDPRLPGGTPGTYNDASDYAFFSNSTADLRNAFMTILSSVGAGDYTTSSPSVSTSPVAGETLAFVASASYPGWKGHLYAYDVNADCTVTTKWDCTKPCGWVDPTDPTKKSDCVWDAGEILTSGALEADGTTRKGANNGLARHVYTWDPNNANTLVEIATDATTVGDLDTICGSCGITAQVADFILGNNGSGSARPWKLGAIMNSTPAIIGPVEIWKQNNLPSHTAFEATYAVRHPVVWVGSSDGMMHAFDVVDGAEIVAVMPPDQLANQVKLYTNYTLKPTTLVTGEPRLPSDHIYGMANSPRFGDVWMGSAYETVLFASEGPGGTGISAIDVTHVFPGRDYNGDGDTADAGEAADPNYSSSDPLSVLWFKDASTISGLGKTWSVPALGGDAASAWQMFMGGGFDPNITTATAPKEFRLNPVDGSVRSTETLLNATSGALVRNQSFADSVVWQTDAKAYAPDNQVNQGVEVDLHGHLWVFEPKTWARSSSPLFTVGAGQPLYYSPAVTTYPADINPTYNLYAFSSGTFYEKSPNVTGPNIGQSGYFIPSLYIGVKNRINNTTASQSVALGAIAKPTGSSGYLGRKTQVTSPPLIFVPRPGGTGNPFALFLAYDPDGSVCVGTSYVLRVDFDPTQFNNLNITSYLAGEGAASGFAIAGSKVIASRSFVGKDGRAGITPVKGVDIPQGGLGGEVNWWQEIQ